MALTDNLVSYWKLDESSGNAADSVGSNTLTNNNTTAFAAGKINNGADFELANSNSFSITDASQSGLDLSGDLTFSFWLKPESQAVVGFILSKWKFGDDNSISYYVDLNTSGNITLRLRKDSTTDIINDTWTTSLANGTMYHIVITWVASTGIATLYKNGLSLGTKSGTSGQTIQNGAAKFMLGEYDSDPDGGFYDGILDEVGVWSRALTYGEASQLYNSGNGSQYSFTDIKIAVDNVSAATPASTTGTSLTYSFTCGTYSNRLLIVTCRADSGDYVTGVTYNSVAMTQIAKINPFTTQRLYMFYLIAPATGANNIVVSCASNTGTVYSSATSYTGCDQTAQPDASNTLTETASGDRTTSVTVVAANSWLVVTQANKDVDPGAVVSGVLRAGSYSSQPIGDSNAAYAAGARTIGFNYGGSDTHGQIAASIQPVSPSLTLSVNDSVTITENVNLTQVFTLSKFDSITVTDTLLSIGKFFTPVVSDSVTVTDTLVKIQLVSFINVFDSITVTDVLSNIQEVSRISVSDSITVTENITLTKVFTLSVFDSITVTENKTLQEVSFINQFDTVTVTDVLSNIAEISRISVSDAITVSENLTMLTVNRISVSDSITVTENINLTKVFTLLVFDSITVSENETTFIPFFTPSVFDSVTVSESVALEETSFINLFDNIAVSENISPSIVSVISVFDVITVADVLSAISLVSSISVFDSITVSEVVALTQVLTLSVFDSVTVSDVLTKVQQILTINVYDSIAVYDTLVDVNVMIIWHGRLVTVASIWADRVVVTDTWTDRTQIN